MALLKNLRTFKPLFNIKDSIQFIKGVGPARKKLFENLGIETIEDLLYFFPRRYEDRRSFTSIAQTKLGETQTISGEVVEHAARRSWYSKKHVTEVALDDKTGRMTCVWFNQPYLDHYFKEGVKVVCHGKVDIYKKRLQMISPEYEIIHDDDDESLSLGRIVPMYPLTRGITQRYLRKATHACLEKYLGCVNDELSVALRNKHHLFNLKRSLQNIHFPEKPEYQEEALKRISFEEFFFFQVSILLRRLNLIAKKKKAHKISDAQVLKFVHSFPFELTNAQKRVVREIRDDMQKGSPMLRLLQGDVGSGKTIVALFGCLMAIENNCQAAIMAPTEILAQQHFESISKYLKSGPFKNVRCEFLSASAKNKVEIFAKIAKGEIDLVIGTHAIINADVNFKDLSFAVIDEQHKFGVRQRSILSDKGKNPDILVMTATPIPRTLCITLYGDLDLSIIDELPKGRKKIKTLHYLGERVAEAYQFVKEQLKKGRQAYIVYPIIDESETLDLKAAKEMFQQFKKDEFKDFRVELLHGQMKQKDSDDIMARFKKGEVDILVATTVLEVGIDVPNATVMVIEHAERFGLSSLHQLRGRIGRGEEESFCLLIADPVTEDSQERIKAVLSTNDGFEIAQKDLLIRGPGQFFGRHQHGLNELKVANPLTQMDILEIARKEAIELTSADPKLEQDVNKRIKEIVKERYPTYLAMVKAG